MLLNSNNVAQFLTESKFSERAQVGIDCSVKAISKIVGGFIGNKQKSIQSYQLIKPKDYSFKGKNVFGWQLKPGIYSLTFNEGINLDSKHSAFVKQKSSVLRCGGLITSGVFDPGFNCEEAGATLFVFSNHFLLEENAQVAQMLIFENQEAELYNGNYQGDKDLK